VSRVCGRPLGQASLIHSTLHFDAHTAAAACSCHAAAISGAITTAVLALAQVPPVVDLPGPVTAVVGG
jgi:hypothetical protein